MKFSIFYSWQSDLPNNTNRGFIQELIEKAINELSRSGSFSIEFSLDRDTLGVPGAPNISQTLIEKIKSADVFVADVSIVTGDKMKNQRPSPNPNILIELGYAIAQLGWEKILLFSNDHYGADNDLPFDIRQHRRFKYNLPPEGVKATLKKQLSSGLAKAIDEIIHNSAFSQKVKSPILEADWVVRNFETGNSEPKNRIELPSTIEIPDYAEVYKDDLETISKIDGQVDPEWSKKIADFKSAAETFISYVKSENGAKEYFISYNSTKATPITIAITNAGNIPASDIRAKVSIPDWLICFEKLPVDKKSPTYPKIPTPISRERRPHTVWTENALSALMNNSKFKIPNLGLKPDHACYLREGEIFFWADKLLHKHTLVPKEDTIYILAKPNEKKGIKKVDCEVFCVENVDWEKNPLEIEII